MFFDNASTTKVDDTIIQNLKKINDEFFYNPSALYSEGLKTKIFLEKMRKDILKNLNAEDYELIFTGSATEANNLAVFGTLKKNIRKILVSIGEHPSIYNTVCEIKNQGFQVEFIKLNNDGSVDIDDFKNKMTSDVGLISIMHVCNENGAINNIEEIVNIAKSINEKVIIHCDGVQAVGKINVNLDNLNVDMYTISAHKIHGFKGVGALIFNKKIKLKPIIYGGGQENNIRSGTENVYGIYSLYKAVDIAVNNLQINYNHVMNLKNHFIEKLENTGISFKLHSGNNCSPYIMSISFLGCRAETLLNLLSDENIFVGNGSACSSKKSGNRILEAQGIPMSEIESNLRISFSKYNTIEEVGYLIESISKCVNDYLLKIKKHF